MARAPLPGSHRNAALGAEKIGPANPSDQAHVTVYVRGKNTPPPIARPGHYITNEEYTAAYGASEEDFQAIRDFAKQYNLTPANENAATRSIELCGTVGDLSRAFGVTLDHVKIKDRVYRGREGELTVPFGMESVLFAECFVSLPDCAWEDVVMTRIGSNKIPNNDLLINCPAEITSTLRSFGNHRDRLPRTSSIKNSVRTLELSGTCDR